MYASFDELPACCTDLDTLEVPPRGRLVQRNGTRVTMSVLRVGSALGHQQMNHVGVVSHTGALEEKCSLGMLVHTFSNLTDVFHWHG